ncbi:MAG: hypothetical protein SPK06_00215 [Kiritimatiellia bacterium]|nr:hypothetical protein [Kiritimatiellia bacterium]
MGGILLRMGKRECSLFYHSAASRRKPHRTPDGRLESIPAPDRLQPIAPVRANSLADILPILAP